MTGSMNRERGRSYYELLQVSPTASQEVIHAAYRALARGFHPDINPTDAAAQQMLQLNAAYVVLGDPAKRAQYDLRQRRSTRANVTAFHVEPVYTPMRGKPRRDAPLRVEEQRAARGESITGRPWRLSVPRIGLIVVMLLVLALFVTAALWLTSELIDDGPALFSPEIGSGVTSTARAVGHAIELEDLASAQPLLNHA